MDRLQCSTQLIIHTVTNSTDQPQLWDIYHCMCFKDKTLDNAVMGSTVDLSIRDTLETENWFVVRRVPPFRGSVTCIAICLDPQNSLLQEVLAIREVCCKRSHCTVLQLICCDIAILLVWDLTMHFALASNFVGNLISAAHMFWVQNWSFHFLIHEIPFSYL